MATLPTFVQEAETAWDTTTNPKTTASFNVVAGDILVGCVIGENEITSPFTFAGGSLTWANPQAIDTTSFCGAGAFTSTVDSTKSMTTSATATSVAGGEHFGQNTLTFRDSDGIGASSKTTNANGAPSLSITTQTDNSAIVVFVGDWNSLSGASRTWRTVNGVTPTAANGYEKSYLDDGNRYTLYVAYYPDAGAAGAKTVGLSAPTGQAYSIIAVEVKGRVVTTFTATSALTSGKATLAGTATFSPGTHTASSSLTSGKATLSATATFVAPVYTASSALTAGAATLSGTATFSPGTHTATAALGAGAATISASVEFDVPVYTATGTLTAAPATLSATSTFAPGTKTASAALTAGVATLSSSATFSPGVHTASAGLSAAPATLSATATFAPGTHTAAAGLTVGAATLAGSATFTAPVYTASASLSATPATLYAIALFATQVYQASAVLSSAPATISASASFVAPVYTAAASLTAPAATASASAQFTVPSYTATASLSVGGATLTASASLVAPTYTATATLTAGTASLSASAGFDPFGTVTAVAVLAAGTVTIAAVATFTPSARGGPAFGTFSCSPAVAGTFSTTPAVSGTLAVYPKLLGTFRVGNSVADVHYVGCDMDEELTGLRDRDGDYLNDAEVTYELRAPGGTVIGSGEYEYETGSDGNYSTTIESTVTENERDGQTYTLVVEVSASGVTDRRYLPRPAQYRGSM